MVKWVGVNHGSDWQGQPVPEAFIVDGSKEWNHGQSTGFKKSSATVG